MGKRLVLLIALLIFSSPQLIAAGGDISSYLNQLEIKLSERDGNVLKELNGIDPGQLKKRSDQALYALLKSEALDNAGIQVTSDNIISPAIIYYKKHGSHERKMRAFFHRGKIDENNGDRSSAMEWYKQAECHIVKSGDLITAGRLYERKAAIYKSLYDYEDACSNAVKASELFRKSGSLSDFANSMIELSDLQIALGDELSAEESINALYDEWESLDSLTKAKCCIILLELAAGSDDMDKLEDVQRRCLNDFPSRRSFPRLCLGLSAASLRQGDVDEASCYLDEYLRLLGSEEPSDRYLDILSRVLEAKGDFKGAYEAAQEHNRIAGESTLGALGSDTKFIEERYEATIRELKSKQKTNSILLTALIIIITLILILRDMLVAMNVVHEELSSSNVKIKELENEHHALKSVLEAQPAIDRRSREILNERFSLLDKVLVSRFANDGNGKEEAEQEINRIISEKNVFISSLSDNLASEHPNFQKYLKDSGLNDFEIGYCTLFVIGMQKKDIENFLSKRVVDTVTRNIRQKIGLEKDEKKLKTVLTEMFKKIENPS